MVSGLVRTRIEFEIVHVVLLHVEIMREINELGRINQYL